MPKEDYTAKLLDLEEVIVKKVENLQNELHVYIELPRKEHRCPTCKTVTDKVHDYRLQIVKDIPLGRKTFLYLRKRRYCCPCCGKRFFENNSFLPRYCRSTSRRVAAIITEFRKLLPTKEIASRFNASASTATRYFSRVSYHPASLPEVLSIDEFKGNAGGEKYQTILTNPKDKVILDILPNRFEADLILYFQGFEHREKVKYFITDMNPHFRQVAQICFPQAAVIADKYHVIRQAVWAMDQVRKNELQRLPARFRGCFKQSRKLLNSPPEKLNAAEADRLALLFEIAPRLATAYRSKNDFLDAVRSESSSVGRLKLSQWMRSAEAADLAEFRDCVRACRNWFTEILNSMDVPWTNGYTEGCNNKTKVLKRVCFGFRNFDRFRLRILHCSA